MIEVLVGIAVVMINGGALISFWGWTRGRINVMTGQVAALETWKAIIERRCEERRAEGRQDRELLFGKIDELKTCFHAADTETARAIGELQGRLEAVVGRPQT